MNLKRWLVITVLLNLALLGGLLWMWKGRKQVPSDSQGTPPASSPAATQPEPKPREAPLTPIQLSPERMQSIGVTFGTVEKRRMADEIRATGNVEVDERRIAYVQTRYAGWLRTVHVNATYQFVRKGQPLFTIYSPDLVATEQEYLLARKNQRQMQTSSVPGVAEGATSLASAARDRLRQWEIADREIAAIEASGQPVTDLTVYSPVAGYVTERTALPNMYVQPDTRLYTVADLSSVWVSAQVFQNDIGKLKPGGAAEVSVDAYPGKTFRGRIDQILPQVDMNTRTVRVRLVFSNPGLLLKPGMFVNVTLKTPTRKSLVVPASAVLQSGTKQMVFMDRGNGMLAPVSVEVGQRYADSFAVLQGLKSGDRVVTSANFLIDSESQLQAAAGGFVPPPPGAGGVAARSQAGEAAAELTTEPSPPRKGNNLLRVKLTTADGQPVNGAEVKATFFMAAMPAMGMAEMRTTVNLADKGNGLYEGQGELGSGGTWQVTIIATQNGRTLLNKQITVNATGGM